MDAESSDSEASSIPQIIKLSNDEIPLQKPRRKKRKTVKTSDDAIARDPKVMTRPRRKPGKLAELPTMPIDVLFEIFSYLMPHDLLKLTRTNKDFRELLLNKNSISVWKDVIKNVPGLPECPPELSEPAWVNLLFSSYCQFCSTIAKKVEWNYRVRMCQKCAKQQLASLWDSHSLAGEDPNNAFGRLEWRTINSLIPSRSDTKGNLYMLPMYHTIESEYNALKGEEARKTYIEERAKSVKAIIHHASICKTWEKAQTQSRGDDLRHLKEERKAAIIQKLKELGWAEDVENIQSPDSLADHKHVNRAQRLTDKVWSNIKDDILNFMQQMREKRIGREYRNLVKTRKLIAMDVLRAFKKARIAENKFMPGPPDFCEFEVLKGILNLPADGTVDMLTFDPIIASLPDLIEQWHHAVDKKMLERMEQLYASPVLQYGRDKDKAMKTWELSFSDQQAIQMKLASTVFTCRTCASSAQNQFEDWNFLHDDIQCAPKKPMFYPQVLGHRCLSFRKSFRGLSHRYSLNKEMLDPSLNLGLVEERKVWSFDLIVYDNNDRTAAEVIIKLAGLDPGVATTADMDQLNLRFLCRDCSQRKGKVDQTKQDTVNKDVDDKQLEIPPVIALYEWRAAVRHLMDVTHETNSNAFIVVRAEELRDDIRRAEIALREKTTHEWACMHCLDTQDEKTALYKLAAVKEHILDSHEINSPVLNEDYFLHFTSPDMRTIQRPLWLHTVAGQLSVIPPEDGVDYDKYLTEHPNLRNLDSYEGCLSKAK